MSGPQNEHARLERVRDADLRLSEMTISEVHRGIAKLASTDDGRAATLTQRMDELVETYRDRTVEIDLRVRSMCSSV